MGKQIRREFQGSWGVVILWLILFFPIAIIYFFMNYKEV